MPKDLHILPKIRDSLTYLYIDKAVIEQDDSSIVALRGESRIPIPIAAMTVLLLGPGTTITHAAVKNITDSGCVAVWCGENFARMYAFGHGETRSSKNLLQQAKMCMDDELHMQVVYRMYAIRFPNMKTEGMTLQQVRGLEGIRVREAYKQAARINGVKWQKRNYKTDTWDDNDPINKAISYANTILYAVCEGAILSLGYSSGLGFIHTGKMLSFVYDIADLYKASVTIPAAFEAVASGNSDYQTEIRRRVRKYLVSQKVLARIPSDIDYLLANTSEKADINNLSAGTLWDIGSGEIPGGKNYSGTETNEW